MSILTVLRPLTLLSVLVTAAVTDAAHHKVYNSLILAGTFAEGFLFWVDPMPIDPISLTYSISFILLTLILFYMGLMGGADVKLYMLTAFAYPDGNSVRIIGLSVVFGTVYGIWQYRKKRCERSMIPMAVFIFAGAGVTLLS